MYIVFFFLMMGRPPRSTQRRASAASDVYKRQEPGVGDRCIQQLSRQEQIFHALF